MLCFEEGQKLTEKYDMARQIDHDYILCKLFKQAAVFNFKLNFEKRKARQGRNTLRWSCYHNQLSPLRPIEIHSNKGNLATDEQGWGHTISQNRRVP